jgi:hypothetical protein
MRDRRSFGILVALIAAPFIVFPPAFVPKALLDGGDDLLANLPELVYSGKKLLDGEIFWTPELWMGHPLLAEPEFATFYFPKLMLLIGPPVVAYAAYLVVHYLAAEFGMYLYLKRLGIGRLGCLFGALAYAYAGFMLGHRAHTMYVCAGAWAPFALLLFDRATDRGGKLTHLGAALAFAMIPFSGAVQLTVYFAAAVAVLAIAESAFDRSTRPLYCLAACLGPGLLVWAVQLLPSRDFSSQLATGLRSDYALDVAHSFHPLLVPTLALPIPPLDAELYARAGGLVVCAVAAALITVRSAPSRIRAWAVVLALSFVLMLGRYVPFVARALHGLPVVGVLRGPARHNFEFALATSVLGAYGIDVARRRGAGSVWRWLLAGGAFSVLSYGAVAFAHGGNVGDPVASELLGGVSWSAAAAAACAFALWLLALVRRSTPRATWLWAVVALAPLFEAAWAMRVEARPNHSARGVVEAARAALPAAGPVRLLSVSLHYGSADVLAGNSVLFYEGVGSLQGYSSIAYSAAQKILDLDMHGQPNEYGELAFSTLPSVFGVTHLVLPNLVCGDSRFALAKEHDRCDRRNPASGHAASPPIDVRGALGCRALTTDTVSRYRLELGARCQATEPAGVMLSYIAPPVWVKRFELAIPGSEIGPGGARRSAPFPLASVERWGGLMVENPRSTPVEFFDAAIASARDIAVSSLETSSGPELGGVHWEAFGDVLRLEPSEGIARVERTVTWPTNARPAKGSIALEVDARAPTGTAENLVVDLYKDGGYDPEDAQLVVPGTELTGDLKTFRKETRAENAPETFLLRAFVLHGSPIEVREARLVARSEERVIDFPVGDDGYRGVRIEPTGFVLPPKTRLSGGVHLPERAFDVLLDVAARGPREMVSFGFEAPTEYAPRAWGLEPLRPNERVRVHHVALLPPDIGDPRLFVRSDGPDGLTVSELSATDACALRGYRNPRRLANGLFLYENPSAVPRAYAVERTVVAGEPLAVRKALQDFEPSDLGTKVVVPEGVPAGLGPGVIEGTAFGQRRDEVVVRAESAPTLLVVNERFDPNWHASIDGLEAAMFPVNGIVRGIIVPEGRHRVVMEYRIPRSFWVGLTMAAFGILCSLFLPRLGRLRTPNRNPERERQRERKTETGGGKRGTGVRAGGG